jgi:tetratricopeptide (TPR) repeat protein
LLLAAPGRYDPETEAILRHRDAARAAATQTEPPPAPALPPRLEQCIATANGNSDAGIAAANQWLVEGGGALARHCLGYAQARAGKWQAAVTAFEAGARELERTDAPGAARLWAQAGNAALAGGDAAKARADFDAAAAIGLPAGIERGELRLDRARALVALGDLPGARTDLDQALADVPQDPLAWLLSATLARRMDALPLAQAHIAEAARRAPDDASVATEQGVIAALSGQDSAARAAFRHAMALAPTSAAGEAARRYLEQLGEAASTAQLRSP